MKYYKSIKGKRVVCSSTNPNPKAFAEITKAEYEAVLRKKEIRFEIAHLKVQIAKTDYVVIKIAEETDAQKIAALREEYATVIESRKNIRARINELEAELEIE